MAVDAERTPTLEPPEVLRCTADDVQRGDQVAFVSTDDEHVAGEVAARRADRQQATVALVVDNRVHFVASCQSVVVIRDRAATADRLAASGSRR